MKNLFTRIAAAAVIAIVGATTVHAACPYRADFVFETHTVYCNLMAEYQGMCLMDCVAVYNEPEPMR